MHTKAQRVRRTAVAACAAPLLLFTGAAAASAATMTTPAVDVQQVSANEILTMINQERQKAGCSALAVNAQLTQAAQAHADDMERNNLTGHTGSDGSDVKTRIERTGYKFTANRNAWAENVSGPGQGTAQAHVTGWLNSPGHKANIDNCELTNTGVGVAGDRVVQVFATASG
ncbi:CAP domain-containing protein [Streptomyces sannanensis]